MPPLPFEKPCVKPDDTMTGEGLPSLQHRIAQHLSRQGERPFSEPAQAFETDGKDETTRLTGARLDAQDITLVAGLEQYLPTPMFRFRVMKKRLSGTIAALEARLGQYQSLTNPPASLTQRMTLLEEQLLILKLKEQQVDEHLSRIIPYGCFWYTLSRYAQRMTDMTDGFSRRLYRIVMRCLQGPRYQDVQATCQQLTTIHALMRERLNDYAVSAEEMAQLLVYYDQTLARSKALSPGRKKQG